MFLRKADKVLQEKTCVCVVYEVKGSYCLMVWHLLLILYRLNQVQNSSMPSCIQWVLNAFIYPQPESNQEEI